MCLTNLSIANPRHDVPVALVMHATTLVQLVYRHPLPPIPTEIPVVSKLQVGQYSTFFVHVLYHLAKLE